MRIRNLLIAILTVGSTVAFAQEQRQIKEEGKLCSNLIGLCKYRQELLTQ